GVKRGPSPLLARSSRDRMPTGQHAKAVEIRLFAVRFHDAILNSRSTLLRSWRGQLARQRTSSPHEELLVPQPTFCGHRTRRANSRQITIFYPSPDVDLPRHRLRSPL